MKTSLGITFLAAAALLLMPQPSAASDDPGDMVCQLLPAGATFLDDPTEGSALEGTTIDVTSKIRNGPCSWCNSNSSCTRECIDDDGSQSDCGDYGVCNWCGTAIVEIGREHIGHSATRKWVTQCEYKEFFDVTYKSQNYGCTAFTVCEQETHTEGPIPVPCCAIVPGCFGVGSCN